MAAAVECGEGRHVAGRSTARSPRGGRAISDLAATTSSHATGTNMFMGLGGARQARFRYLDEDGYAIHRHLVVDAGLEYLAAHDSTRIDGSRSILTCPISRPV